MFIPNDPCALPGYNISSTVPKLKLPLTDELPPKPAPNSTFTCKGYSVRVFPVEFCKGFAKDYAKL